MNSADASRRRFLLGSAASCLLGAAVPSLLAADKKAASTGALRLPVRWQEKAGGDAFVEKTDVRTLPADQTAILICDLWNQHWCASATRRCGEIAKVIAPLVSDARAAGVYIVHAPSDTLEFYKDHPARQRAMKISLVTPPSPIAGWCKLDKAAEGDLPIDDSDGGCDCQPQCKQGSPWTRQHPAVEIAEVDFISDDGKQVYSYFVEKGIKNVLYMGVHTNMCVLGRSFGIRQMSRLGLNAVLMRDLTDTMYNPRMKPFVPHEQGTALVVSHVERHWCPTATSTALVEGLRG
jgi:nicotinamidase-related amidase